MGAASFWDGGSHKNIFAMKNDFYEKIGRLRAEEKPFVIATVVRAEKPTSAKAGAKALITGDGMLDGWVGGSCAEPSVRREARRALEEGRPRLIRLCPPEMLGKAPQEGVVEIALTCISGGTLEIYIEPQLSQPHLVVIGHLATAQALLLLGAGRGWRVSVMGLDVAHEAFPDAMVFNRLDFSALHLGPSAYVVVASHGNYDEDMLVEALKSEARYVALVASRKRAEAIQEYLHESDLEAGQIARLEYPAGLDIGAETPEEIAVSILAEMIAHHRRMEISPGEKSAGLEVENRTPGAAEGEAIDPVCGMIVEIAGAHFRSQYNGNTYFFCAAGCQRTFDKDPEKYIPQETSSAS